MEFSFETAAERAEIFFVGKTGRMKEQMVVDCRRRNVHWRDSASVALGAVDDLSRLNIDPGGPLFTRQLDINDALCHMELPKEDCRWFGLRCIRVGYAGVTHIAGRPVDPNQFIETRLRPLPTAWSWALWWCRAVHERRLAAAGFTACDRIRDLAPSPPLHQTPHVCYVDNLVIFGVDWRKDKAKLIQAAEALEKVGLTLDKYGVVKGKAAVLV